MRGILHKHRKTLFPILSTSNYLDSFLASDSIWSSLLYCEHDSSICCSPLKIPRSSSHIRWLITEFPARQPVLHPFNCFERPSIFTLNRIGDRTWRAPLFTWNRANDGGSWFTLSLNLLHCKKIIIQSASNHGLMPCIIIVHLIHSQRALIRKNDFENNSPASVMIYVKEIYIL